MFENIEKRFEKELKLVNEQFDCQPFKCKTPVVKITYEEGMALLKENGVEWDVHEDIDTPTEKKLGEISNFLFITQSKKYMTLIST